MGFGITREWYCPQARIPGLLTFRPLDRFRPSCAQECGAFATYRLVSCLFTSTICRCITAREATIGGKGSLTSCPGFRAVRDQRRCADRLPGCGCGELQRGNMAASSQPAQKDWLGPKTRTRSTLYVRSPRSSTLSSPPRTSALSVTSGPCSGSAALSRRKRRRHWGCEMRGAQAELRPLRASIEANCARTIGRSPNSRESGRKCCQRAKLEPELGLTRLSVTWCKLEQVLVLLIPYVSLTDFN